MSKHTLILRDSSLEEVLEFLDKAEEHGQNVPSVIGQNVEGGEGEEEPANVSYEARQLKTLFLRLRDCT